MYKARTSPTRSLRSTVTISCASETLCYSEFESETFKLNVMVTVAMFGHPPVRDSVRVIRLRQYLYLVYGKVIDALSSWRAPEKRSWVRLGKRTVERRVTVRQKGRVEHYELEANDPRPGAPGPGRPPTGHAIPGP